jgi:hypothetical protein
LTEEIEMKVEGYQLIIQATHQPRQGWEGRFAAMAEQGDDRLLDEISTTDLPPNQWTKTKGG